MKVLIFFVFCLLISSLWANPCRDDARTVLSSSSQNQQRFIKGVFLSKLFNEFVEIIRINKIKIKNQKIKDIFLQWGDDARNPHVVNLFEVAGIFGVSVSDLFKHYGNLVNFVDPSGIVAKNRPLTAEKQYRISERIHLHLSGLVSEILREKNIPLEKLAFQTGIKLEVFQRITIERGVPRLRSLLEILVRLDADVVDFFKRVEASLEQGKLPPYFARTAKASFKFGKMEEIEKQAANIYDEINRETKEILERIHLENANIDVVRFRNIIDGRNYYQHHLANKKNKRRISMLARVFQTARMLGMRPSEVLKYFGNLRPHVQLEGIAYKTLLNDEEIKELLGHVRKKISDMFKKSGMQKEELAQTTQLSLQYLHDIDQRGLNPNYSTLEKILQALGSNTIHFLEELESKGVLDVHATNTSSLITQWKTQFEKGRMDSRLMGERILKIWEVLAPVASKTELDKTITRNINTTTGQNLSQRDFHFKTLYKASRVANIPLSDLAGERPIEILINPQSAKIEKVSNEDIERAERLLAHLLLNEARRQRDVHGLTVVGLGIKSHLFVKDVRRILSGEFHPSYSSLVRMVENGLDIPLARFLENFEEKLKSFERIPFTSKRVLLELEGPYLSQTVRDNKEWVRERIQQAIEFLKNSNIFLSEIEKFVGIQIRPNRNNKDIGYGQIFTIIKFCHVLGINIRDFLGRRNFSELVAGEQLNFERLPQENILHAIGKIKQNINQRRKILNLSTHDLEIMLGGRGDNKLINSLLSESVTSFPWYRYFQLAEILARIGEDSLFLLDGIDL